MNERKNALLMSGFAICLLILLMAGPVGRSWAQDPGPGLQVGPEGLVPPVLQYQGRLLLTNGNPITDGLHVLVFRLYTESDSPTPIYTETDILPYVSGGLVNTLIGDVTPLDPLFFNGQQLWLGVTVDGDAEATPRQPTLPVPYAMGLTPGAIISGTTGASPATLVVRNLGAGDALRVEGSSSLNGNLSVSGSLVGGTHSHDASYYNKTQTDTRYVNADGGDSMLRKDTNPTLMVDNNGGGQGVVATSSGNVALRGNTGSIANELAGVMGVAGWTNTMLIPGGYAGVYGKSRDAHGVAGVSDYGYGVYGQSGGNFGVYGVSDTSYGVFGSSGSSYGVRGTSGTSYGVYGTSGGSLAGIYGRNTSTAPGVQGYSGSGWGGYFTSGSGGALYAGGNSTIAGTLTTQRVAYSSPRTHYWSVGGEGFQPSNNGIGYNNYGGQGGACVTSGTNLVAAVHLPHGAVVTSVTGKYRLNNGPSVTVALYGLNIVSGSYIVLGSVAASTGTGYSSPTDSTILYSTIDNLNYGYFINAYWSSPSCNTEVMGAVVAYTLSEAE